MRHPPIKERHTRGRGRLVVIAAAVVALMAPASGAFGTSEADVHRSTRDNGSDSSAKAELVQSRVTSGDAKSRGVRLKVRSIKDVAPGPSPYDGRDCNVTEGDSRGFEGESRIIVNPRDPRNKIVVFMDRSRDVDTSVYTRNGGRTWHRSLFHGTDECTGNFAHPWEASGVPQISFGPDGVAYASVLSWANFRNEPLANYLSLNYVFRSTDGGATWRGPVLVGAPDGVGENPELLADPFRPGTVYLAWYNTGFGLPVGERGDVKILFSRSDDHGRTWTEPSEVEAGHGTSRLFVQRDGTLVYISQIADPGGTRIVAYRSVDGGSTWTPPILIRQNAPGGVPALSVCGHGVSGSGLGVSTTGYLIGKRTLGVVSIDAQAASVGRGKIILSTSVDGGLTWSDRTVMDSPHRVFNPGIAGRADGTVAVFWDEVDVAGANCEAGPVPARTQLAVSGDGGARWTETTVGARWWDLGSALSISNWTAGSYWIGYTATVAPTPNGFTLVTTQGRATEGIGPRISGTTGVVVADVAVSKSRHK